MSYAAERLAELRARPVEQRRTARPKVAKGESHYACKLSDAQVRLLRKVRAEANLPINRLSAIFGVSKQRVSQLLNTGDRRFA